MVVVYNANNFIVNMYSVLIPRVAEELIKI